MSRAPVEPVVSRLNPGLHHHRNPDFRRINQVCTGKPFRRYADHFKTVTVKQDRFADDTGVATEAALPARITEYGNGISESCPVIISSEDAPMYGLYSHHIKIVTG